MTTKITIINESDLTDFDNHAIEVTDGAGHKSIVGPEKSITVNVWAGTQITITELDSLGSRRGGPDGYGALPGKQGN